MYRRVDENSANATLVTTIAGADVDGDTLTYSITAGNGAGHFAIDANTGAVTVAGAIDFEVNDSYSLTIQVADAEFTDTAALTISVNDVNEAPTLADVQADVDENAANGTLVTTIAGADVDGDALTYSIKAGNGAGHFAIDANSGAVTVAGAIDFETNGELLAHDRDLRW